MVHTVLLVEDEEDLRELLREALEWEGYHVVAATNGEVALAAMDEIEHVCLVLLDLLMPVMNGWEFFTKMKERPQYSQTPVVVQSSAPTQAPMGVVRVLQKPVKLQQLLSVVGQYCAK